MGREGQGRTEKDRIRIEGENGNHRRKGRGIWTIRCSTAVTVNTGR